MQKPFSTALLATFAPLIFGAHAAFNPSSPANVAVYWGQGPNQRGLIETCRSAAFDIVNVAFINVFPDQGPGGYPGTNFGNACGARTYTVDGVSTKLASDCASIGSDIKGCQDLGKKVLLSLGGAWPTDYWLKDDGSARRFADFLWGAFGPPSPSWSGVRPFGDASVDGFDFDIESLIDRSRPEYANVPEDYQSRGYGAMIDHLKNDLFPTGPRTYYISGAPQCVLPDARLSNAIATSWFDFIFVQFWNTYHCSARAGANKLAGTSTDSNDISWMQWADWVGANSFNKNAKIYLGLVSSR